MRAYTLTLTEADAYAIVQLLDDYADALTEEATDTGATRYTRDALTEDAQRARQLAKTLCDLTHVATADAYEAGTTHRHTCPEPARCNRRLAAPNATHRCNLPATHAGAHAYTA